MTPSGKDSGEIVTVYSMILLRRYYHVRTGLIGQLIANGRARSLSDERRLLPLLRWPSAGATAGSRLWTAGELFSER